MLCSQHTPAKRTEKQPEPRAGPCAPWRPVLDGPPAARALSPIARLIAAAGRDKGCDIGLIFPPADGGSDMKPLAAARFLPALFHFLCPRANRTPLSHPSRAGPRRARQKRVRGKTPRGMPRGEKSEGKDVVRKRKEGKAYHERRRGKT